MRSLFRIKQVKAAQLLYVPVFLQPLFYLLPGLLDIQSGFIHNKIRVLLLKRGPFVVQILQCLPVLQHHASVLQIFQASF